MDSKAQSSLEFLMTYGWTLIMVVMVVGVLVFIAVPPASQEVVFSTPVERLLLKGSDVSPWGGWDSAELVLTNIYGSEINVVDILGTRSFEGACGMTINDVPPTGNNPVLVGAGHTFVLGGIDMTRDGIVSGSIDLTIVDRFGLTKVVSIPANGTVTALPMELGTCSGSNPAMALCNSFSGLLSEVNPDDCFNAGCCGYQRFCWGADITRDGMVTIQGVGSDYYVFDNCKGCSSGCNYPIVAADGRFWCDHSDITRDGKVDTTDLVNVATYGGETECNTNPSKILFDCYATGGCDSASNTNQLYCESMEGCVWTPG